LNGLHLGDSLRFKSYFGWLKFSSSVHDISDFIMALGNFDLALSKEAIK